MCWRSQHAHKSSVFMSTNSVGGSGPWRRLPRMLGCEGRIRSVQSVAGAAYNQGHAPAAGFLASDDAQMAACLDLGVDGGTIGRYWRWNPGATIR
jgi:hypothetical protein